jgi:hypothetical protein
LLHNPGPIKRYRLMPPGPPHHKIVNDGQLTSDQEASHGYAGSRNTRRRRHIAVSTDRTGRPLSDCADGSSTVDVWLSGGCLWRGGLCLTRTWLAAHAGSPCTSPRPAGVLVVATEIDVHRTVPAIARHRL